MASINKVILVGNLGRDPEVRYTPDNNAITNISVATTDRYKDKHTGEQKEITEWHRVVFYRKLAEIVGQYLKKGSSVYIEGRIRTRKWQDKEGQERYTTEIEANEMQMLGGKPSGESAPSEKPQRNAQGATKASIGDMDDDIPFTQHGAGRAWRVI